MNPLTDPAADPLAGLRAYHLPEPPSWWPPAPGWWLLAACVLMLLAALAWWLLRRRTRRAAARAALRELGDLRATLRADDDAAGFVRALSKLLRRYAISAFPRRDVAALTGDDWLYFLDRHGGDGQFAGGPGRQLLDAPYRRDPAVGARDLAILAERWIRHNREPGA